MGNAAVFGRLFGLCVGLFLLAQTVLPANADLEPAWAPWIDISLYAVAGDKKFHLDRSEPAPAWLELELRPSCNGFPEPVETRVIVEELFPDFQTLQLADETFKKESGSLRLKVDRRNWYNVFVECWARGYRLWVDGRDFYADRPSSSFSIRQEPQDDGSYLVHYSGGIEAWALRYVERVEARIFYDGYRPGVDKAEPFPVAYDSYGNVAGTRTTPTRNDRMSLFYWLAGDISETNLQHFPKEDELADAPGAPDIGGGAGPDVVDPNLIGLVVNEEIPANTVAEVPPPGETELFDSEPTHIDEPLAEEFPYEVGGYGNEYVSGEALPEEMLNAPSETFEPIYFEAPFEAPGTEPEYDPVLVEAAYDSYLDSDGDTYADEIDPDPADPCYPDPMVCSFFYDAP